MSPHREQPSVPLHRIVAEWIRLGTIGFGGPPAHIALLRTLCVEQQQWIGAQEFEDAIATTNLLPGPASTQLAIYCAWRVGGSVGAIIGGLCFILPGLFVILGLAAIVLAPHPPGFVLAAASGAGAVAPAVALSTARGLVGPSAQRMGSSAPHRLRFGLYLVLGVLVAAWSSVVLVVVIAACGLTEVLIRRPPWGAPSGRALSGVPVAALGLTGLSGLSALSWVALKVGALSYGGGFVIIPMMEHDAVSIYHWMTAAQFLHAVALGQVTPGPVVQTVAAVGYAAHGLSGGLLASAIAFLPSFLFVLGGARHFQAIRQNRAVGAFLTGAGPATIGAIAGSFIPLAMSFGRGWQWPVLGGALIWLMGFRQGVVSAFGLGALSGLALFALGVS